MSYHKLTGDSSASVFSSGRRRRIARIQQTSVAVPQGLSRHHAIQFPIGLKSLDLTAKIDRYLFSFGNLGGDRKHVVGIVVWLLIFA